jgi:hypothetical protein
MAIVIYLRISYMNAFVFVYIVLLFVVLTPGILVSLPPKGSKYTVAITHAIVFGFVWWITHKYVWQLSLQLGV